MIDAHQHFWRIDRGDYGWLTPALGAICRDFGPDDLAPILARHAIDATILVQAAPTIRETRWLLDLAAKTPFVAGVVGWAAFEAPDVADHIAALAAERRLVGLRPMVQDEPDGGQRTPGRRPQDSRRLVPRSGMRRSRTQ
jgi:L-fuconolactonase